MAEKRGNHGRMWTVDMPDGATTAKPLLPIFCGDCVSGAQRRIPDGYADLVICDPPFGLGEGKFGKQYNRDASKVIQGYVEAPADYRQFTLDWMEQAKRILKDDGSMYVVISPHRAYEVHHAIRTLGFNHINTIEWAFNFGVYATRRFVCDHYHIFYLSKSRRARPCFNTFCRFAQDDRDARGRSRGYADRLDVWHIPKEYHRGQTKNPNKLPDALVRKMMQYSSNEGDVVCDFFMGNFTTARVALELGRFPMGFEMNREAYNYHMQELHGYSPAA